MQETLSEPSPETVSLEQHNRIPVWLVFVYLSLFIWTVWNLIRYWD